MSMANRLHEVRKRPWPAALARYQRRLARAWAKADAELASTWKRLSAVRSQQAELDLLSAATVPPSGYVRINPAPARPGYTRRAPVAPPKFQLEFVEPDGRVAATAALDVLDVIKEDNHNADV